MLLGNRQLAVEVFHSPDSALAFDELGERHTLDGLQAGSDQAALFLEGHPYDHQLFLHDLELQRQIDRGRFAGRVDDGGVGVTDSGDEGTEQAQELIASHPVCGNLLEEVVEPPVKGDLPAAVDVGVGVCLLDGIAELVGILDQRVSGEAIVVRRR